MLPVDTESYGVLSQLIVTGNAERSAADVVDAALQAARTHLGMDVAFVSELAEGRRYFRHVDTAQLIPSISVGQSDPAEDGYCLHVVEGRLPELIPDTTRNPLAMAMPVTRAFPIGAHISVPIRLKSGQLYGTFCCFSYAPDPSLGERDLRTVRAFADLVAHQLESEAAVAGLLQQKRERIGRAMRDGAITVVYQPICRLASQAVVGFEGLSRFAAEPSRTPDVWFAEALEVGLGVELELAAVRKALEQFEKVPGERYLSINLSPATLQDPDFSSALAGVVAGRTVLEITEHASVEDYDALNRVLAPLRECGVRLAIDDAGAGFASMRHVLNLKPDLIKLDISLVRCVDSDNGRLALAAAMVTFAEKTGAQVVAEGIETAGELEALRAIGVHYGQGYYLGRPAPL